MLKSYQKIEYHVLDNEIEAEITNQSKEEQADWLLLYDHPTYQNFWYVDGIDQSFFFEFEDLIGKYRTVSPASIQPFLSFANNIGYKVAFIEDPEPVLREWRELNSYPSFRLNSNIGDKLRDQGIDDYAQIVDDTGMLPFQIQGFNYLRNSDNKAGLALWSTGVGKTALKAAIIKQHLHVDEEYYIAFVVVKSNNKIDTQRKIKEIGDIESIVIEGDVEKRRKAYMQVTSQLSLGLRPVCVMNYEKFRDDREMLEQLIDGNNVLILWDEMPTKLSNSDNQVYQSVSFVLYGCEEQRKIRWANKRPNKIRQYCFTATPIQNNPIGLFNQVKILDPDVYPTKSSWTSRHVQFGKIKNRPIVKGFFNIDEMGLKISFMTHQVDKSDEDIARLFPSINDPTIYLDWSERDWKIYREFQSIARKLNDEGESIHTLQIVNVLQIFCSAPSSVVISANNRESFEKAINEGVLQKDSVGSKAAMMIVDKIGKEQIIDDKHAKILFIKELLIEKHPKEKFVIFSKYANYIQPIITKYFEEWGVPYVVYTGTDKQKLKEKDRFRNDPNIRIFISSDAGSDSIDIPEGSVAVDYDEPFSFATKVQRRNRIHRVNSEHDHVTFYTLRMVDSVEERIAEIIQTKGSYHNSVFQGAINEIAVNSRADAKNIDYVISGKE